MTRAEELSLGQRLRAARARRDADRVAGAGLRQPRASSSPPAVRAALKDVGLALEVVDTGSACRIYNVLLAEGRRVAAALIPL